MKTMYRVEERVYTDCEGRHSGWTVRSNGYVATIEEARVVASTITKKSGWDTGDWRIIACTMDETTFTVEDTTVEGYDWWREVGRYDSAREDVERYTKEIASIEASKARCKTEKGVARKDKEIAMYREWLARAEAILAEKNK